MPGKLGLVAGAGDLPRRLVDACRSVGRPLFIIAIEGFAAPETVRGEDHAWVRLGAAGEMIRRARAAGVEEFCFAGKIRRPSLRELRPDATTAAFFAKVGWRAFGDNGLMQSVIKLLEAEGFGVVAPAAVLGPLLATEGPLGRLTADDAAEIDIRRGVEVLNALSAVDVGQCVVVQQGLVLGVEAIEGTDALLARCGGLRRDGPGGVLVKCAKTGQERRMDLPAIGVATVTGAAAAGLRGIAIEAGGTLVVDRDAVAAEADRQGLFVVGIKVAQ